jgi:hypothetical protein
VGAYLRLHHAIADGTAALAAFAALLDQAPGEHDHCPDLEVFTNGVRTALDDLARSALAPAPEHDAKPRQAQGPAQGDAPMSAWRPRRHGGLMARYLLHHRHEPEECGVVFASFKGHHSPLRHRTTLASCRTGGHAIWWTVEAGSEDDALRLLPYYVAERTTITRVTEVHIP